MGDITLFDYLAIIRRRWLLILIIPLLAVGLSSAYLFKDNTPVYEARAKVAVGKRVGDETGREYYYIQIANRESIETYVHLARSGIIAQRIAAQLPDNPSPGAISGGLSISTPSKTQLLDIRFTYPDAQKAADICNLAAQTIIDRLDEIEQGEIAMLVDPAVTPSSPVAATGKLAKVVLAGLLGLLGSVLLAFLLEFSRNPKLKNLR